jgi:hypothetical protein
MFALEVLILVSCANTLNQKNISQVAVVCIYAKRRWALAASVRRSNSEHNEKEYFAKITVDSKMLLDYSLET